MDHCPGTEYGVLLVCPTFPCSPWRGRPFAQIKYSLTPRAEKKYYKAGGATVR
jgi:hypothetical protein